MAYQKKLVIGFLLSILATSSMAQMLNVYLKLENPKLIQEIETFNQYLHAYKQFKNYKFRAFIEQYPVHISLYQAAIEEKHMAVLQSRVRDIALHWKKLHLETGRLNLAGSNFLMLDIEDKANLRDAYSLQSLSDQVTLALSPLRDASQPIPRWAENMAEKRKAFQRYGSPNVFFEYEPHISLMAYQSKDLKKNKHFVDVLGALIANYQFKTTALYPQKIALGYVNALGQIEKEIASYSIQTGI